LRAVIYRPSIVYGHSQTGRSLLFNAVYHPVKAAVFLRDVYLEDIRTRGGQRTREVGVRLAPDGTLQLPLRIEAEGPGIDLVPVDFLTDAFAAIHALPAPAGMFHIVSGRPTPVSDIAAFTSRLFGLNGLATASPAEMAAAPRTALEAAFDQMTDVYRPYMSNGWTFAAERTTPILSAAGLTCPEFTFEVFERCMSYAVATDWGRRIDMRRQPG
jgi:nucleoside-diphosphate-sugar epimerase